ncbi:hypothetical protein MSAN_01368800 [Mycena sanguinolenta]|uniref:Uncharacterized protein n=1 Tax=Mycena sanguinolenta TaxID=230812 RepID=A0A8H6Y8H1_9AGAR|nr:hypothetical protein MSAN_01368800 [Mycena sanguinolenta]
MVNALTDVRHQSSDPPTAPALVVTTRTSTGGRPRVDIDHEVLAEALNLRGPTHLRNIFHVSARTIRRRALEYGLVKLGAPVYTNTPQGDGTISRTYTSTSAPVSTITDDELDAILASILQTFPNFGQRMLKGRHKVMGHRVPREHIAASYLRVHGSPGSFGARYIHHTPYTVAGANSLWHHDGQHGLSHATGNILASNRIPTRGKPRNAGCTLRALTMGGEGHERREHSKWKEERRER